jgi:hypothetical protein
MMLAAVRVMKQCATHTTRMHHTSCALQANSISHVPYRQTSTEQHRSTSSNSATLVAEASSNTTSLHHDRHNSWPHVPYVCDKPALCIVQHPVSVII